LSPNSVAGCISNVECSVGGNLELRHRLDKIFFILLELTKEDESFPDHGRGHDVSFPDEVPDQSKDKTEDQSG
jgi:hypothetical protein